MNLKVLKELVSSISFLPTLLINSRLISAMTSTPVKMSTTKEIQVGQPPRFSSALILLSYHLL